MSLAPSLSPTSPPPSPPHPAGNAYAARKNSEDKSWQEAAYNAVRGWVWVCAGQLSAAVVQRPPGATNCFA